MDAAALTRALADTINAHDWAALPHLLHPDFRCALVHTGETFARDEWVRFNAGYPGFESCSLVTVVAEPTRAAARAAVTGVVAGATQRHEVAQFLTVRDGLIDDLVEIWIDLDQEPPVGTRAS